MIFGWVHADAGNAELQRAWGALVARAHATLGDGSLPYGQPRSVMCPGASETYWYRLAPGLLDINSVSNRGREGASIGWLRDMFFMEDPLPVINVKPYYPGPFTGGSSGVAATTIRSMTSRPMCRPSRVPTRGRRALCASGGYPEGVTWQGGGSMPSRRGAGAR